MKVCFTCMFASMTLVCCSTTVAQVTDKVRDTGENLRSTIFIKSDREILFIPNAADPELKRTQEFRFDDTSQAGAFNDMKKAVGGRPVDLRSNPNVRVKLFLEVGRLFTDRRHDLKFYDFYLGSQTGSDSLLSPNTPQEKDRLGKLPRGLDPAPMRKGSATRFDEIRSMQMQQIDAHMEKLWTLRARIEERGALKDEEIDAIESLKETIVSRRSIEHDQVTAGLQGLWWDRQNATIIAFGQGKHALFVATKESPSVWHFDDRASWWKLQLIDPSKYGLDFYTDQNDLLAQAQLVLRSPNELSLYFTEEATRQYFLDKPTYTFTRIQSKTMGAEDFSKLRRGDASISEYFSTPNATNK